MTTRLFTAIIRLYKIIVSPLLPPSCRFHPTCSDYACGSIEAHGVPRGALLAAKRLLRCHPFAEGGYDPVPGSIRMQDVSPHYAGYGRKKWPLGKADDEENRRHTLAGMSRIFRGVQRSIKTFIASVLKDKR